MELWSPLVTFDQLRSNRTLVPKKWGVYIILFRDETGLVVRYAGSTVGKEGLWSRILFDREDALKSFVPDHIRQRVLVTWYPLVSADKQVVLAGVHQEGSGSQEDGALVFLNPSTEHAGFSPWPPATSMALLADVRQACPRDDVTPTTSIS